MARVGRDSSRQAGTFCRRRRRVPGKRPCHLGNATSICYASQGCCTLSRRRSHSAESGMFSFSPRKQEEEKSPCLGSSRQRRAAANLAWPREPGGCTPSRGSLPVPPHKRRPSRDMEVPPRPACCPRGRQGPHPCAGTNGSLWDRSPQLQCWLPGRETAAEQALGNRR